jgi:hypothetical protein
LLQALEKYIKRYGDRCGVDEGRKEIQKYENGLTTDGATRRQSNKEQENNEMSHSALLIIFIPFRPLAVSLSFRSQKSNECD